ncbi:hypothetical protein BDY17DRAFT_300701 [Neohortaea acidophila]|uniref:HCP-like protein n=1 Tax=Neohortaea acidophila TaxID=245834 RepID=A0A6A6PLZ5_9PEZI|nr:uncharacterized protein BDY17DRAFT_300701 [Neohortaea acidophila]KAF2481100.1 hypothetical protein BDY17DRAFT_300701 [Neohortaea acidophila]
MPGLRDLLRKKEKIEVEQSKAAASSSQTSTTPDAREFKFIRSTTDAEELIEIPSYSDHDDPPQDAGAGKSKRTRDNKNRFSFRKSRNEDTTKEVAAIDEPESTLPTTPPKSEKRLSHRFRRHSRSPSAESSSNLPTDLPDAPAAIEPTRPGSSQAGDAQDEKANNEQREAQWEKRATILARSNPLIGASPTHRQPSPARSHSPSITSQHTDETIQEAIRLHETGELAASTAMFSRLADPATTNNALAQVLYGLALRHGWGTEPNPAKAIHYLSLAASNSASVESAALEQSGMKKGGAAKGELVLAIYELANCFRYGWGVKVDAVAARNYYETAANLGDTDAMEEVAWCYLEGFGGGKDKFTAAKYLRIAEEKGHKTVGNSWIWKDKYANPKPK